MSSRIAVCGQQPVSTAHDALVGQHSHAPQGLGVLGGEDVVGDDGDADRVGQRAAQARRRAPSCHCRPARRCRCAGPCARRAVRPHRVVSRALRIAIVMAMRVSVAGMVRLTGVVIRRQTAAPPRSRGARRGCRRARWSSPEGRRRTARRQVGGGGGHGIETRTEAAATACTSNGSRPSSRTAAVVAEPTMWCSAQSAASRRRQPGRVGDDAEGDRLRSDRRRARRAAVRTDRWARRVPAGAAVAPERAADARSAATACGSSSSRSSTSSGSRGIAGRGGEGRVDRRRREQRPSRNAARSATLRTSPRGLAGLDARAWAWPPAGNRPSASSRIELFIRAELSSEQEVPLGHRAAGGRLLLDQLAVDAHRERVGVDGDRRQGVVLRQVGLASRAGVGRRRPTGG